MVEKMRAPQTPEEAARLADVMAKQAVNRGSDEKPNYNQPVPDLVQTPTPTAMLMVDGFLTPAARDIFANTGDNEVADRTDALIYLLSQPLYDKVKIESNNCGLNNEALYLRQLIMRETLGSAADNSMTEAQKKYDLPKRTSGDDNPISLDNQDIAEYLADSNLGAIRSIAKSYGTTNVAALRIVVAGGLAPKTLPKATPRVKRRRSHAAEQLVPELEGATGA